MARMIQINGNWEVVESLQDIIKIIRVYYDCDLANELEDLIPEHTDSDYYDLESELRDLEDAITSLEYELDEKDHKISCLEETITELENT